MLDSRERKVFHLMRGIIREVIGEKAVLSKTARKQVWCL